VSSNVTLRLVVRHPLLGVELRLQRGRDELVPPVERTADAATFEFQLSVKPRVDGGVVLRGPEAQGPPVKRFVYINAGTYAGQTDSPWSRRAKVSLSEVRPELVTAALAEPGSVIVGVIDGRGRDGGPAAATVPLLADGWSLTPPSAG
jgi:hypothetical protein